MSYKSLEDLDLEFLNTKACKDMLLHPKSSAEELYKYLPLIVNIGATYRSKYYVCSCSLDWCVGTHRLVSTVKDAPCHCGKKMDWRVPEEKGELNADGGDRVFIKGKMRFMIRDDLQISAVSSTKSFALLNKFGASDTFVLEEMNVNVGEEELVFVLGCLANALGFLVFPRAIFVAQFVALLLQWLFFFVFPLFAGPFAGPKTVPVFGLFPQFLVFSPAGLSLQVLICFGIACRLEMDTLNIFDPLNVSEAHQRAVQLERQSSRKTGSSTWVGGGGSDQNPAIPTRTFNQLGGARKPQVGGQPNRTPTTGGGSHYFKCGESGHRMANCRKGDFVRKGLFMDCDGVLYDQPKESKYDIMESGNSPKEQVGEFEVGDFVWAILTKDRFSVGEYNRLKLPSHIRTSDVFNVKHLVPYHCDSSEDETVNSRANSLTPSGNDVVQIEADEYMNALNRRHAVQRPNGTRRN
ncbi:hypothetical protein MRB53_016090 [Persea americana]|uniref:Uncharacterized protein n=1 Tax=Persea americana TaxID=3435 RepID=A0ACC2M248_PERAE|nr:hypothetical protein MRB53_016090 [Persea americana]